MTEQQLSSSDIQLCQACQKSELYAVKSPQQLSNMALWVLDIEHEMVKHFTLHPVEMYLLHPRKFEELIAAIFRNQGFQVELTPQTRDSGCDFIAIQNHVLTGNLC
jgi:restriction system protein